MDKETKHFCVTIDGASACGKSTTAKAVADALGMMHLDTGAIYRSMALWIKRKGGIYNDSGILDGFTYAVKQQGREKRHYIGGEDVTEAIRTNEISQLASKISALDWVRLRADEIQREIAVNQNIVVDGRDAGTKVFPFADVKVFLSASFEERAKRRLEELKMRKNSPSELSLDEVKKEIEERDERDKTRVHAPLKKPVGAVTIDTSNKSFAEVVATILTLIKKKQKSNKKSSTFMYKLLYGGVYVMFRLLYRLRVKGLENCPKEGAIVASNHVSFLDPPAVGVVWPYEMHFLAQDYLFRNSIIRWLFSKIHCHPISKSVKDIDVMKQAIVLLEQGNSIIVFPEGTRSYDGKLLPLKPGIVFLASFSGKPVVPTYVRGAYKIWPRRKKLPHLFGRLEVVFGKPLYWKDFDKEELSKKEKQNAFLDALYKEIDALSGENSLTYSQEKLYDRGES